MPTIHIPVPVLMAWIIVPVLFVVSLKRFFM